MKENIIGVEAAIWSEFITNQKRLEYMYTPRLLEISEVSWTQKENKNWNTFKIRLRTQFKRYDANGINYRIPELTIE